MSLFKKVLWHFFDPYERVEADDGYHAGHMDKVKFPTNTANLVERQAMQGRVRARQKTLHGWLKKWGVLSHVFCHHISLHGNVFRRARW